MRCAVVVRLNRISCIFTSRTTLEAFDVVRGPGQRHQSLDFPSDSDHRRNAQMILFFSLSRSFPIERLFSRK